MICILHYILIRNFLQYQGESMDNVCDIINRIQAASQKAELLAESILRIINEMEEINQLIKENSNE